MIADEVDQLKMLTGSVQDLNSDVKFDALKIRRNDLD